MKKNFIQSVVFIVMGVLFAVLGFNLEMLVQEKYADIPYFIAEPSLAEDAGPTLMSICGVVLVIAGIILFIMTVVNICMPLIEKEGKIVEILKHYRDYDLVIVEYADGSRLKLSALKKHCIVQGDYGIIGTKGKIIEKFTRIKSL